MMVVPLQVTVRAASLGPPHSTPTTVCLPATAFTHRPIPSLHSVRRRREEEVDFEEEGGAGGGPEAVVGACEDGGGDRGAVLPRAR